MHTNKYVKAVPWILVLINLVLKLMFISSTSIGGDEPFSIYHAQMDIPYIIHQLSTGNNPPLYEIVLHFWIKSFGISPFAVRLPSVLFSAFTVVFIYKIGKAFFSFRVALVAALLFTFSNFNLLMAHEARVYSMFAFFTAMSSYYFIRFIRNPKEKSSLLLMLASNLILIYAHYFGFFVIASQTLSLLLLKNKKAYAPQLKFYFIGLIVLFILYIPNLTVIVHRFFDTARTGTFLNPPEGVKSIYNMLRTFSNQPLTTVACIVILVASLILYVKNRRPLSFERMTIMVWFIFPFTIMFAVSYRVPMFFDRYLLFVSLGYYLMLAVVAGSFFGRKRYNNILGGVLVVLFAVTFNPNKDNKRHVKETIAKVMELKDSNTAVIFCPTHFVLNFSYYYNPQIFKDADDETVYGKMFVRLAKEHVYTVDMVNINTLNTSRVIYLDAAPQLPVPGNDVFRFLQTNYKLLNSYKYYEIFTVYEFEKN